MTHEPYFPVGMSDAEAALLRQAHRYRGVDVLETESPVEIEPVSTPAKAAWEQARTKLRRTIIGKPVDKKAAKKSSKRGRDVKRPVKFTRGGALAAAIVSLMLMPMFGIFSLLVAMIVSGRAIVRGRLRGGMLIAMVFVQLLSWALLFNVA